jgi:uncharacterized protein (DUF2249 family)
VELTPETRLSSVLDAIPGALSYIVSLRPHEFQRLHNPVLRKYMSPRISLRRVAAMAGIGEDALLHELSVLAGGGATVQTGRTEPAQAMPISPLLPPAWLAGVDEAALHIIDVLPIDEALGDPLPPINAGIKRLAPGGVLVIRHRWEPQPLYDVWTAMRLEWFAREDGPDRWSIFVYRPADVAQPTQRVTSVVDLRALPVGERVPRLVAMYGQLAVGEYLDLSTGTAAEAAEVRTALEAEYGTLAHWEPRPARGDGLAYRITRRV